MTSTPPPKKRPPAPKVDEDDASKTVKLSATELRQQLQDLGVDLDAVEDRERSSDERALKDD